MVQIEVTEARPEWIVQGDWTTKRQALPLNRVRYLLRHGVNVWLSVCGWAWPWACRLTETGEILACCPVVTTGEVKVVQIYGRPPAPPRLALCATLGP